MANKSTNAFLASLRMSSPKDDSPDLFPSIFLSQPRPADSLKRLHPATFPETDVMKLVSFFTKRRHVVLDPFLGSGSTMAACMKSDRSCVGFELFGKWIDLTKKRLSKLSNDLQKPKMIRSRNALELNFRKNLHYSMVWGDARIKLKILKPESIDFVITSPPYWNILEKTGDHKTNLTRRKNGLPTNYGTSPNNLSNIKSYPDFLRQLGIVLGRCVTALKADRYMCVIAGDFRHQSRFYAFHDHLIELAENKGVRLEGITVIADRRKHLYPYGMPYAFVSNIQHRYALIFRKRN